ncbi:MAG: 2-hydroxychromene-2-carboxylate isomerase [Rhizobiales bacterium]|nr:2-hydroxychromene-2-carboxylate isomerase [Hyphomicrobiales bacterium]
MADDVVVYYALQSPWTYLGWRRFLDLAADKGVSARFRPIRMAPVFEASGGLPLARRPKQRQAYRMMELRRWREVLGVPLTLEPAFFPVDEALAALMVIAHGEQGGDMGALSLAMLRAVWAEERNLADPSTLATIAAEQGLDGAALMAQAGTRPIVDLYEAHTRAALADGVFGVPTFKLGDELFWGQDRLDLLARALG